ncbi:hypothetical protein GMRT_12230 [Giardia muris]|uniref:Uncharacterized protein n=1 Tax=Giardia muris TaxID=5742 RepID=A0A4Z1SY49_GIAMU|nr:hypothetical protein GMRT_12230 [Giardia muris]|eukprot:TNJ30616.1 hypothetical protein GMRT_12230 [Giardia muris]
MGCCGVFWRLAPPVLMTLVFLEAVVGLTFFITCLATSLQFRCFLMEYCALSPGEVFQYAQVWRLFTAHLVPSTIWQTLFVASSLIPNGFVLEKRLGSLRYLGFQAFCIVFTSAFTSALAAILHFTPGINNWSYFRNQWFVTSDLGPTTLVLFNTCLSIRCFKQRAIPFWCCQLPSPVYIILMFLFCQLMMYPPWYGLFYNAFAVCAAYVIPDSWIRSQEDIAGAFLEYLQAEMEHTQVAQSEPPAQPSPTRGATAIASVHHDETFTGARRAL